MSSEPSAEAQSYPGQPYENHIVMDVASINADTTSRWQHLPSEPITIQPASNTSKNTSICQTRVNIKDGETPEDIPVIYIDIPGNEGRRTTEQNNSEPPASNIPPKSRRRSADTAVVYIDLPETRQTNTNDDTAFVEETIFYDPFDDRRIDVRSEDSNRIDDNTERRTRLALPLYCESPVDDGLRLSPIPVPEYPEPPPAYTEVDTTRTRESRTQVVVPDQTPQMETNSNRKLIVCPYCGQRVLTRTARESGVFTHILAIVFLFACFPMLICIYCTDCCKYRNHYCPRCNQFIAYEVPVLCQDTVYTKM